MILVKSLILFNSERATPIRECNLRKVPFVPTTKPLYDMLNLFQEGRGQTPAPPPLQESSMTSGGVMVVGRHLRPTTAVYALCNPTMCLNEYIQSVAHLPKLKLGICKLRARGIQEIWKSFLVLWHDPFLAFFRPFFSFLPFLPPLQHTRTTVFFWPFFLPD